jgi:hypothetical protein
MLSLPVIIFSMLPIRVTELARRLSHSTSTSSADHPSSKNASVLHSQLLSSKSILACPRVLAGSLSIHPEFVPECHIWLHPLPVFVHRGSS